MGPFGVQEMIAVFIIALVLFGPKKLPELGRTLGKALTEFRRAQNELKATLQSHLNELEKETRISETTTAKPTNTVSAPSYDYPYEDYALTSSAPAPSTSEPIEADSPLSETPSAEREEHVITKEAQGSSESAPVAGTFARTNGVRPLTATDAEVKEEHSA